MKEASLPKLSYEKIYQMIWRRSSSVVKWIFYISIFELIFWLGLDILLKIFDQKPALNIPNEHYIQLCMNIIMYPVILYFIYSFYRNYKNITTTSSVKELMKSILKTRRTVKYYVWFNLGFIFFASCILYTLMFIYDPELSGHIQNDSTLKIVMLIGILFVSLMAIIILLWLFYKLIYGILLGKLHKNYKELERMEGA